VQQGNRELWEEINSLRGREKSFKEERLELEESEGEARCSEEGETL